MVVSPVKTNKQIKTKNKLVFARENGTFSSGAEKCLRRIEGSCAHDASFNPTLGRQRAAVV